MTAWGMLAKLLLCLLLVFATWNPTGHSYLAWVTTAGSGTAAEKAVASTFLLIAHVLFLRITWVALRWRGLSALALLSALTIASLSRTQLVNLGGQDVMAYLLLTAMALTLAAGLNWAHVKRRVLGQSMTLSPPP